MDPHLAAKIAAGEVIERPASVVKELVENALDAGATWVRVEVENGGAERIVVADDGSGIQAEEVELAFRRHATSKLKREADLDRLVTLGFRGEALPSIAAIADVVCTTRANDEAAGTEVRIDSGAFERRAVARQPGTTLEVLGLFSRFPARRKFLRTRSTEAAACLQVVVPLALSFAEVRFEVRIDGREVLRTPGRGTLREAAAAVLGSDADAHLLEMNDELVDDEGRVLVRIRGLCGTGSYHRASRSGQFLLLNRRPIQNRTLGFAVHEAYGSLVPVGRHPVAVVQVDVPPDEVDFNVHPSKLEVKLLRERAVFGAVQRAIRTTLGSQGWTIPTWDAVAPVPGAGLGWPAAGSTLGSETAGEHSGPAAGGLLVGGEQLQALRVVGQVGSTYVVAEGDAGVYLVDQHAAHERVQLEALRASLAGTDAERQLLLEPLVVAAPAEAVLEVERGRLELLRLGFDVQAFGADALLVRAVPALLAQRNPERLLGEAVTALVRQTHGLVADPQATWVERLALVLACKSAVRAGDSLGRAEMEALLRQLGETALCRTCAHGRPTAVLMPFAQLEREFGRR